MPTAIDVNCYRYDAVDFIDAKEHHSSMAIDPREIDTLGKRVKYARTLRGLGVNELDRAIKKGIGYTSRVEAGKRLRLSATIIARIADVLEVDMNWLVSGEGDPSTHAKSAGVDADAAPIAEHPAPVRWVEEDDIYPSRPPALILAKGEGVPQHILDAVALERRGEGDPGTAFWLDRIAWYVRQGKGLRERMDRIAKEQFEAGEWDEPSFEETVKQIEEERKKKG